MGSLSDYAENRVLNHFFNSSQTVGSTVYIGLSTADPTDAATGASCNECANANNYARKVITFGAPASRRTTQSAQVDFNTASGSWGTVTHWFIADSATYGAGNVLAYGALSSSISPVNGNTPRIASGQVWVQIDAIANYGFTTYAANAILGHLFCATSFTSTAGNTFLALLTSTCSDAATTMAGQAELSGNGYAKKEVNENGGASPAWTAVSGGALSNGADVTFATPTGAWATFVAVAIVDASSGTSANVIAYDNTITDQPAALNDTVQFLSGDFDISLS